MYYECTTNVLRPIQFFLEFACFFSNPCSFLASGNYRAPCSSFFRYAWRRKSPRVDFVVSRQNQWGASMEARGIAHHAILWALWLNVACMGSTPSLSSADTAEFFKKVAAAKQGSNRQSWTTVRAMLKERFGKRSQLGRVRVPSARFPIHSLRGPPVFLDRPL